MTLKFSEKIDHPSSHVFVFGNMFTDIVTASLLCRLQGVSKIHVPINLSQKGEEVVRLCDRHSNETVTLGKLVTKYKRIRKLWSNLPEHFRIVALKLLELTQFASPNRSIYFNFYGVGGPL